MSLAPSGVMGNESNVGCCNKTGYIRSGPTSVYCLCAEGYEGTPSPGSCVDPSQLSGCNPRFPLGYLAAIVGGGVFLLLVVGLLVWKFGCRKKQQNAVVNQHIANDSELFSPAQPAVPRDPGRLSATVAGRSSHMASPSSDHLSMDFPLSKAQGSEAVRSSVQIGAASQPNEVVHDPRAAPAHTPTASLSSFSFPPTPTAKLLPQLGLQRRKESLDFEASRLSHTRAGTVDGLNRRKESLDFDYKRRQPSSADQSLPRTESLDLGFSPHARADSRADHHVRAESRDFPRRGVSINVAPDDSPSALPSSLASPSASPASPASPAAAAPRSFVNGGIEYAVVKQLGGGHFGKAYLVWSEKTQKLLVLKAQYCDTDAKKNESFKEATALSKFSGPNLLKFSDLFIQGPHVCIVMTYCSGGTLADEIPKNNSIAEITRLIKELCAGLFVLHSQNYIHRDIKPDNIFLSDSETRTVIIGDLGMAREVNESGFYKSTFGHALYKAPEIGGGTFSSRSDMWAVGCVALELLCHQSTTDLYKQHIILGALSEDRLLAVIHKLLAPYISDPIFSLVRRLLVLDPAGRMTARDVVEWAGHPPPMEAEG